MTEIDLKTLCTALGFTAVAMQEHIDPNSGAIRAQTLASLIEEFCKTTPSATTNHTLTGGNLSGKSMSILVELADALELCLSCNGQLTWEAEQEADTILIRARKAILWSI